MDPHYFGKLDPNPHLSQYSGAYSGSKWSREGPCPLTIEAWRLEMEPWRLETEPWRVCIPVVAYLHHFDEDPDPDLSEKSDPDPHLSEKSNPYPQ